MAQYKQHVKFNLLIALPAFLLASYYLLHPSLNLLIAFAAIFIYSSLFMNPDLYKAHQTRFLSIRGLLTLPLRPYSLLIRNRRLSHHIIFGTLTRILWAALLTFLAFLIIYKSIPSKRALVHFYKHYELFILYGLAAVCLSDWCYLILARKERQR